jgi:hypothetical protein
MHRARLAAALAAAIVTFVLCLAPGAGASERIIYSEGFETGDGGYTAYDGTSPQWQWGTPCTSCIGPGAAHSGARCWGTNLAGAMPRPCDGSIVSPAITLPPISGHQILRVRFWAYVDLDGMSDRGEFLVSKDRTNWQSLLRMYGTMQQSALEPLTWHKYEFTLDPNYRDTTIYLRFRVGIISRIPLYFCDGANPVSGVYFDDIAISMLDTSESPRLFTLEAWEDTSSSASCPWVAPWNGSEFVLDNDVYSVARGAGSEYTDFYRLMKPLEPEDGVYPIALREIEQEVSFTDMAALLVVDHAPDVAVAPDDRGNLVAYRPAALVAPRSATTSAGEDVLAAVSAADGAGYAAYDQDAVVVDFGDLGGTAGATLVLGVKGFVPGTGANHPYTAAPAVMVETEDTAGRWQERGFLRPRYDYSVGAFDLPDLGSGTLARVRLRSISHSMKYHLIDYVALGVGPAPAITATRVAPVHASFGATDVLEKLAAADGDYFQMSSGQEVSLAFPVLPLAAGETREFVFVARGYYVPGGGTYLVSTWDGSSWVVRDSYTYPQSKARHDFDLSLFLPDPNGEYRVRVWQDYQFANAGIDYVQMTAGGILPLATAWDYHQSADIKHLVLYSDGLETRWGFSYGSVCPRDRLTEYTFQPLLSNHPPRACPPGVTATNSSRPVICWTYSDEDGDPQVSAEAQIWTGPDQTGVNVWNPPPYDGTGTCLTYSESPLPAGKYYAGVRASDGSSWSPWCWATFESPGNEPPVARCKSVTAAAGDGCTADVPPEGVNDGSYDPDGDPITLALAPPGPFAVGTTSVMLVATDDAGLSDSCYATVNVTAPRADPVTVALTPDVLWPPNHEMVTITAHLTPPRGCGADPATIELLSVASNEPVNPKSEAGEDADVTGATIGTRDTSFCLRAERLGGGTGRIYTVCYRAIDARGDATVACDTVFVPHDQGGRAPVVTAGRGFEPASLERGPDSSVADERPSRVMVCVRPNPARGWTTLSYALPAEAHVRLSVYDIMGRQVARLVDGVQSAGAHGLGWQPPPRASGLYLVRLETAKQTVQVRFVVTR